LLEKRLWTAALTAVAALLLLPAAGQAAQVFGSGFVHEPNQSACAMLGPCTIAAFVEIPAEGKVVNGGAPSDGVITKLRIRAKVENPGTQVTFRVADVTQANDGEGGKSATAAATATGPTVTLQTTGAANIPIQEFPARLAVKKGQHLAIDGPAGLVATYDSSGSKFSYAFAPPLADGAAARTSNEFFGELLVQGTIEPDADRDGFGDETQDGCPSQASTQGACDNTVPVISNLHVRKGKISYRLSEAATVILRVAKKNGKRLAGRRGRPFAGPGEAGANRLGLPGARRFRPGVYLLTVTAVDAAGNSRVKTKTFRIRARALPPRF
jgi:hypothetical protein